MMRTSLSIIAITLAVTVSSKSVTSPDVCFSDLDCPDAVILDTFCNRTDFSKFPSCVPRLPLDAVCGQVGPRECQEGLTCTFSDLANDNTCQLPPFRGEECSPFANVPCTGDLICERNTKTCQSFTDGFAGTPCEFDRQCQQDKGFYCQTEPGVCAPKRGPGGECNRHTIDNFECLGFCASESFDDNICVRARKEGELCTNSLQCDNDFFNALEQLEDPVVCNTDFPSIDVGRCIRTSRLINQLGAKCDPDHDRCDVRRSLSCKPTRKGHVCQHRTPRFDSRFPPFCDPKSRFSRCARGDEKTECRLERGVPGKFGDGQSPFFKCLRKSEEVRRGGVCITEYAVCADGTECRVIPDVTSAPVGFSGEPPQRIAYCVHIAQKHESCGDVNNKFKTQCAEGLRCEKGKCMKIEDNEPPSDETDTHAGLGAFCSDLPCAPGLVCEKEYESDLKKKCQLPLRIVGKGRACTDRATERRDCEGDLVCILRKDGRNIKRCREPRKVGDFCQEDYQCSDGLECLVGRCFDPKTSLSLGDPCNPVTNASEAGCLVNERPTDFDPDEIFLDEMRCLRKGDGFACRVVMGLFVNCDEASDITCDTGLTCGNLGLCIPVGEV